MDVKFINPFLQGTLEVLKKMAFMNAVPGKVYLKKSNLAAGDVSGVIGITGDATGSLAISFTETCICDIVNRMLGESYTTTNREVLDAVGEITNMISGVARTYMERDGMTVYAAIPTVIFGKDHSIDPILDSPSIIIPFSTEKGNFNVDVCIKPTAPEAKNAENFQVINRKTVVPGIPMAAEGGRPTKEIPPGPAIAAKVQPETEQAPPQPPQATDRKTLLKNKIKELTATRDEMQKKLLQNPFMEISQRKMLKSRLPQLETKIRQLMLDISTIDKLEKINLDADGEVVLAKHFQHYDGNPKRKP